MSPTSTLGRCSPIGSKSRLWKERQPAEDLDDAIQVVLEPQSQIVANMVDGRPVIPLQETVAFVNEDYATFESALDILGRMYDDVDTDAAYQMELA